MSGGRSVIDEVGNRYGRLSVLYQGHHEIGKHAQWVCLCDCGSKVEVNGRNLRRGITNSCGCLNQEQAAKINFIHGLSRTPEYISWARAKDRCNNLNNENYKYYGGRGIKFCKEWESDFIAFLNHVGFRPTSEHSLDRINNDGNYELGNIRWATRKEQRNNRRD